MGELVFLYLCLRVHVLYPRETMKRLLDQILKEVKNTEAEDAICAGAVAGVCAIMRELPPDRIGDRLREIIDDGIKDNMMPEGTIIILPCDGDA